MKLNNKGFAISSVLYGLLAVLILVLMLIFAIMRSSSNNSKELSTAVEKQINACRVERLEYNNAVSSEKDGKWSVLEKCITGIKKGPTCVDAKIKCNSDSSKCSDWNSCTP